MAKSLKPLTVVPLNQSRLVLEEKRLEEKRLEESRLLETIPSLKRSWRIFSGRSVQVPMSRREPRLQEVRRKSASDRGFVGSLAGFLGLLGHLSGFLISSTNPVSDR
jgi:hypothetical protein